MNNKNIFLHLRKELSKIDFFFKKKEFDTVIKKSKILLKKNPSQAIIYNYIGLSYLELDKTEKALELLLLANEKIPSETSILCNIGIAFKKLGNLTKARNYFYEVLNLNPKHLPSHINLGHLEGGLNNSDQATKHYTEAYNLNNNLEEVLIYSILNLSSLGKFTEAKKIIYELNSKFPKDTKSYQLFSKIHKYEIKDNHQQMMLDKIKDQNLNYEDLSNLYFALAKSYFDQKNIEKFVHYTLKANETKFKTFHDYNFATQETKNKQIINYFNNFQFQEEGNRKGENLIFIVGLPRSGTTLLHQIISSHSKVFGADESHILGDFFKNKLKNDDSFANFSTKILLNEDLVEKLSDEILAKYKMYDENKIIVDKMPFNFQWIGFIKILFPKAKIIHSNRNIIDSTFSIYRNLFEGPTMGWAYNQNYLIKYVNLYSNLMSFWKQKMENFIYDCHYETLVSDQLNETKKVLKFCNLEFENNCMNFDKNKTPVKTVSISQARQKIYKSSVNLSNKYVDYFPFLNQIVKKKAP